MTDERLILAIGRLERALARVETLALALHEGPAEASADLQLRDAARDAIIRIDQLLASAGEA